MFAHSIVIEILQLRGIEIRNILYKLILYNFRKVNTVAMCLTTLTTDSAL